MPRSCQVKLSSQVDLPPKVFQVPAVRVCLICWSETHSALFFNRWPSAVHRAWSRRCWPVHKFGNAHLSARRSQVTFDISASCARGPFRRLALSFTGHLRSNKQFPTITPIKFDLRKSGLSFYGHCVCVVTAGRGIFITIIPGHFGAKFWAIWAYFG